MKFSIPFIPILDDMEDLVIPSYCGPKKWSFKYINLHFVRDLHEGDFFLASPCELEMYLVWMGKVHSDAIKYGNDEHYWMVHV